MRTLKQFIVLMDWELVQHHLLQIMVKNSKQIVKDQVDFANKNVELKRNCTELTGESIQSQFRKSQTENLNENILRRRKLEVCKRKL